MQAGRLQSIMEWLSDGARSTPEVGRFMAESCELHVGQMLHGNIGGGRRLDFTCIGPAVNLAARLEKIAGTLNRTVVASPVFASAFSEGWSDLGEYPIVGFRSAERVYGLADEDALRAIT